jgi:hypothetical protein
LQQRLLLSIRTAQAAGTKKTRVSATLSGERSNQSQELYMFARNGDKARFNRERKQKIAPCKRTSSQLAE